MEESWCFICRQHTRRLTIVNEGIKEIFILLQRIAQIKTQKLNHLKNSNRCNPIFPIIYLLQFCLFLLLHQRYERHQYRHTAAVVFEKHVQLSHQEYLIF